MFQPNREHREKHQAIASKISFILFLTALVACAVWFIYLLLRYSGTYSDLALDEPSKKEGISNAIPFIQFLEEYKLKHGTYPLDAGDLLDGDPAYIPYMFSYHYEVVDLKDNRRTYFLSFRKRWTSDGRYCYYSEDMKWVDEESKCSIEARFSKNQ